jgi:hypothetical protein
VIAKLSTESRDERAKQQQGIQMMTKSKPTETTFEAEDFGNGSGRGGGGGGGRKKKGRKKAKSARRKKAKGRRKA